MTDVAEAGAEVFRALAGEWRGHDHVQPSPWSAGGTVEARVRNVPALGGRAVVHDYQHLGDGRVLFSGHGVFRLGDGPGEVVLHWFDSLTPAPREFRGAFRGGVLTVESPDRTPVRCTWDFRAEGRCTYRMEIAPGGGDWAPFIEGEYRRAD
jgi:hypothetical protein